MSVKSVLVHVDHSNGCKARLDLTFDFAAANDAHVSGVGVADELIVESLFSQQIPLESEQIFIKRRKERLQKLKDTFTKTVKEYGD